MEKLHYKISISGIYQKPGISLQLMRAADLYDILGYAEWVDNTELIIHAEGKASEIGSFITSVKEIPGLKSCKILLSKNLHTEGFREFLIVNY